MCKQISLLIFIMMSLCTSRIRLQNQSSSPKPPPAAQQGPCQSSKLLVGLDLPCSVRIACCCSRRQSVRAKDRSTGQVGRRLAPAKHGPSPVCYAVASRVIDASPAPPSQRAAEAPSTPGHTVSRRGHCTASAADTVKQILDRGRSIRLGRMGKPLFAGRMAETQGFGSDTPHSSSEAPARSPRPNSKAPRAQASRQAPPRRQPPPQDSDARMPQHSTQHRRSWHCCLLCCTSALGCHGGRVGSVASG